MHSRQAKRPAVKHSSPNEIDQRGTTSPRGSSKICSLIGQLLRRFTERGFKARERHAERAGMGYTPLWTGTQGGDKERLGVPFVLQKVVSTRQ